MKMRNVDDSSSGDSDTEARKPYRDEKDFLDMHFSHVTHNNIVSTRVQSAYPMQELTDELTRRLSTWGRSSAWETSVWLSNTAKKDIS